MRHPATCLFLALCACAGATATNPECGDGGLLTFYQDADGDGFGDPGSSVEACTAAAGFVDNRDDCDDTTELVAPGVDEICNGIDDDCDNAIDDDDDGVIGTTPRYQDRDGDGFGNPTQTISTCESQDGYVKVAGDCDDTRDTVYEGAPELCDGRNNNCDSVAGDEGRVSFIGETTHTDVTSQVTGSPSAPAEYTTPSDGTLRFCAGTHYVHLQIDHDVTVTPLEGLASEDVTLHGGSSGSVITVDTAGRTVLVSDVSITGGGGTSGGAVRCVGTPETPNSLTVEDSTLMGNATTGPGGAVAAERCDVTLDNVLFEGNEAGTAGGAVFSDASDVTATEVRLVDNTSIGLGAGFHIDGGTSVFDEVHLTGNVGVAVALRNGDLSWTGTASTDSGAVLNEDASGPVGGLYLENSTFDATVLDFGTNSAGTDNLPFDVWVEDRGYPYWAPDNRSFSCDPDGCGISRDFTVASFGPDEGPFNSGIVFNTYWAESWATIERFEQRLTSVGDSCTVEGFVLEGSSPNASSKEVVWRGPLTPRASDPSWWESGDVGVAVTELKGYAVGIGFSCTDPDDRVGYDWVFPIYGTPNGGIGRADGSASQQPFAEGFWTNVSHADTDAPYPQRLFVAEL